jgi:2-keto-4-pentenoate hydratase/2-oxohepta-3-ene-1,7-dioic acid hydratase in catechol pathway
MKILRFDDNRVGALKGKDRVVDLSDLITHREYRGPQGTIGALIEDFASYKPEIEKRLQSEIGKPLESVKLLAPLARPSNVFAAFSNYEDQNRTADMLPNEFFHKSPDLIGPEGTIELPDLEAVSVFHAEAELAVVIGKHSKKVSASDAMQHVFGYMPFFDVSARGLKRYSQLVPKGQDTFAACGPWIATADEIPDPHNIVVRSWLNGTLRQDYSTSHMANRIPAQIAWLSGMVQLHPGDVIATGTYHVGLGPVNAGETLEIEIEAIGKTRFHVKGNSPRKEIHYQPGGGGPGIKLTKV